MNKEINNQKKGSGLKIFFIKLISIVVAVVITINLLFNILIGQRLEQIDEILFLNSSDVRLEFKNKIRNEINKSLKKDSLLYEEDKILLYKLYKKIIKEFDNIEKNPS
jgi:hypothetical protein|tara:strand:+ start:517 stop:840 length:324 start_codon:yes stop_codon:yes gene_type:complete